MNESFIARKRKAFELSPDNSGTPKRRDVRKSPQRQIFQQLSISNVGGVVKLRRWNSDCEGGRIHRNVKFSSFFNNNNKATFMSPLLPGDLPPLKTPKSVLRR